jgi:DNA polymerase III delta subunit
LSSLVIINGEEEFLKERAARDEATGCLSDCICEYDAKEGIDKYLDESSTPMLFGQSRVFILWNATIVPELPPGASDVLVVVSQKKPILDARAKRVHNFQKFKVYDDNNQVVRWIIDEGMALNIDLSQIASALFVNHGRGLRKIASEIKKLAVLNPSGVVTPEVARSVVCFSADLTPKEVVDSICNGQTSRALAFYDKLQERTDETGWIIAYLQRHVLQYIRLDSLFLKKSLVNQIPSILGVHPFMYKKVVLPRARLWSRRTLVDSMNTLCDLDIAHKRGDECSKFGLETEIIRLAEEAKKNGRNGNDG